MDRQTDRNELSEMINPFGTEVKQTKWIKTDKKMDDSLNSISK